MERNFNLVIRGDHGAKAFGTFGTNTTIVTRSEDEDEMIIPVSVSTSFGCETAETKLSKVEYQRKMKRYSS